MICVDLASQWLKWLYFCTSKWIKWLLEFFYRITIIINTPMLPNNSVQSKKRMWRYIGVWHKSALLEHTSLTKFHSINKWSMSYRWLSHNGRSPFILIPIFLRSWLLGILPLINFHANNLIIEKMLIFRSDLTILLWNEEKFDCYLSK